MRGAGTVEGGHTGCLTASCGPPLRTKGESTSSGEQIEAAGITNFAASITDSAAGITESEASITDSGTGITNFAASITDPATGITDFEVSVMLAVAAGSELQAAVTGRLAALTALENGDVSFSAQILQGSEEEVDAGAQLRIELAPPLIVVVAYHDVGDCITTNTGRCGQRCPAPLRTGLRTTPPPSHPP